MIGKIVEMSDRRMSIRTIAAELDMSRSTVHRLLKMSHQIERSPVRRAVFQPTPYHPAHKEEEFVEIENIADPSEPDALPQKENDAIIAEEIDIRDEEELEPVHLRPEPELILQKDGYGREILVESEDARGKPMVWYQTNRQGITNRYERQGFGIRVCQAAPT